jgi:collagenase-like PrtC family protease
VSEIETLKRQIPCEIECFIFGNHGLMAEGRCSLTNYATGFSTNTDGVCSPASHVRYEESADGTLSTRLGEFTIDCFGCNENPGYPTICKGRYLSESQPAGYYAFEAPVSLNLAKRLKELIEAGVDAFKIEGRQRSKAYVKAVVSAWRNAIDNVIAGGEPAVERLLGLTEGHKQTEGAYAGKRWR